MLCEACTSERNGFSLGLLKLRFTLAVVRAASLSISLFSSMLACPVIQFKENVASLIHSS